jgi:Domain of unknown function (DUF4386)
MQVKNNEYSVLNYARTGGIFYLMIIIAGVIGQVFIRGSLIVPGDGALTASNIMASPLLWRAGITGDLMMHIFDIPLMTILYMLLKPVNKGVALLGLVFNIIQTAILVVSKLALIVPLIILTHSEYLAAFASTQINAQIMLLTDIHNYGLGLGLIFFGFACLAYGYLLFKSNYFPKIIGVLMTIAGISYLINSFTLLLAPQYSGAIFPVLILCLIAELTFALWLTTKGVIVAEWEKATANSRHL